MSLYRTVCLLAFSALCFFLGVVVVGVRTGLLHDYPFDLIKVDLWLGIASLIGGAGVALYLFIKK